MTGPVMRVLVDELGDVIVPRVEYSLDKLIDAAATRPDSVVREARRRGLAPTGSTPEEQVRSLARHDVATLDLLAEDFVHTYTRLAAAQGLLTGLGGFVTMPVTIPADTFGFLVWTVRVTSAVMCSYGFEAVSAEGRANLRLGLLAATGARRLRVRESDVLLASLARQQMTNPYRNAVVHAAIRGVARRVGVAVSQRHVAKLVPVLGGALNGAIAAGLVHVCGQRSRRHYRGLLVTGAEAGLP